VSMDRRSTVALVLVGVLLLSGCSAVLDGGNGAGTGTGTGDGVGNGDSAAFEYPDGYGPDGVTDGEAAVRSHQTTLIDSGNYTSSYVYTINNSQGRTVIDVENRVDFDGQAGLQRAGVTSPGQTGDITSYRESDTRYRRSERNNQTSVTTQNSTFDATNLTATDPIRPLLTNISQYNGSVETRSGEQVVVYETSGADGVDSFAGINESALIRTLSASMTVDSDGVVRSATYEIRYTVDGERQALTVEYEVSGVGETSVDRPTWVDDA